MVAAESGSLPQNLPPGGEGKVSVLAEDLGDATRASSPVVVTDKLPAGLTAAERRLQLPDTRACCHEVVGEILLHSRCRRSDVHAAEAKRHSWNRPYARSKSTIKVKVAETAESGEVNEASITGGGAPSASVSEADHGEWRRRPRLGLNSMNCGRKTRTARPDTQAGSHPFQLTTRDRAEPDGRTPMQPPRGLKDLRFNLPPGLIGNPTPFPQCT